MAPTTCRDRWRVPTPSAAFVRCVIIALRLSPPALTNSLFHSVTLLRPSKASGIITLCLWHRYDSFPFLNFTNLLYL
ncbi:hypothetical protein EDB89DRAFT_2015645 [Lactarius sanguifluus]|nr:hypothetical protein EDB89DRAFT_2015645 [Lactarius sanguifluus]